MRDRLKKWVKEVGQGWEAKRGTVRTKGVTEGKKEKRIGGATKADLELVGSAPRGIDTSGGHTRGGNGRVRKKKKRTSGTHRENIQDYERTSVEKRKQKYKGGRTFSGFRQKPQ